MPTSPVSSPRGVASDPSSIVRDVSLVVYSQAAPVAALIREPLLVCGAAAIKVVVSQSECISYTEKTQPDVLIVGIRDNQDEIYRFLRNIRLGATKINRFISIIVAQTNPDARAVRGAINAGTHEFLVLPASMKAVTATIYRAAFVSRPFVEVAGYQGPCRRRRELPEYRQSERRVVQWSGYKPQKKIG